MPETPARNTGAHFAYAELKRRILSLELKPGERLYEPAMASALQVSRTPLREAIRRLISESLLEQQPTGECWCRRWMRPPFPNFMKSARPWSPSWPAMPA